MRGSFRDSVARNPRASRTLAQQCAESHDLVRQRLVEAFGCDFPAASASASANPDQADAQPDAASPTSPAALLAAQAASDVANKANAYTEVQNDIVTFHPLRRQLAEHLTGNERVLRLGAKLGTNAWYSFGISGFDGIIERLEAAAALPGALPEVDPAAIRLLAALQELNPVVTALDRYQTTREFKEDGFQFAREQQPLLVERMKAAIKTSDDFSSALFDRRMALDERRLEELPQDSFAQRLLATSLTTRRLVRRYELLGTAAEAPAFLATMSDVVASNKVLVAAIGAMNPKADHSCASYTQSVDSLIGHGRDMARSIRSGSDASQPAGLFADAYNRSVRDLSSCRKDEARARS